MDDTPRPPENAESAPESEAHEKRRLAWEAEMIAEADADIEAGLLIDADDVNAWIDSLGTDHELPPPEPRR
jgi:predicted transcriptional regulator